MNITLLNVNDRMSEIITKHGAEGWKVISSKPDNFTVCLSKNNNLIYVEEMEYTIK